MEKTKRDVQTGVFIHHIYEFKKGLRDIVLCTVDKSLKKTIADRLKTEEIDYLIYPVGDKKINIFFGNNSCIRTIETIGKERLQDYTDEEDFILGIMLGYDIVKQCDRFIRRKRDIETGGSIG